MEYRDNVQLDPSQMGGGGGGGRRGGMAIGGGIGGLIIALIALFLGIDPGGLTGGGAPAGGTDPGSIPTQCRSGADIKNDRDCRFVAYTNSIQGYWSQTLQGYRVTKTHPFTGSVSTACGQATSDVGPFYCPGDETVYLDYGFFDELTRRFGAQGGDAAEAYVIAHEYGHHISNQIGTMAQANASQGDTGPRSGSVRLELQADCFAGAWLKHATDDPNSPIASITQDDLNRAADAARAVGDDRIQKQATGRVDRESWTHGSANMRQKWLATGFNTGDPAQCNTFDPNVNLG